MATVEVSKLSQQEKSQLACTYAALILYDDGQDITPQKLTALISNAGVNIEAFWPKLFAKAVAGQNISSFFNFGGSGPAVAEAPQVAAKEVKADDKKGKKDEKKKAPKEQPKPEEEEDGGMGGLFD